MDPSYTRYLVRLGASLAGVFAVAWLYVALMPMAYMESGYAAWTAKKRMLDECRLGQVAFFGDSRVEAGIIPASLPVAATNFGLAAGTAVEVHSAVRRALDCPNRPAQIVIGLTPAHFGPLSKFYWLLSVRYGFLPPGDVYATEHLASALADDVTLATPTPDGFHGRLRDWLYALRFPSLSFASLVQGQGFGRYRSNLARLQAVLESRGWSEYRGGDALDVDVAPFRPTPVQNADFEATLRLAHERGVEVLLLVLPFARSDGRSAESQADYLRYLQQAAARVPGVHLVSDGLPYWPDALFADGEHLSGAGAHALSARLASCMQDGKLRPGCELAWREESSRQAASTVLDMQQKRDGQH